MCETTDDSTTTLAKSLHSPGLARDFVEAHVCPDHGARAAVALQLLASELVTNAVLYGEPPISMRISCSVYSMRVTVHDANKAEPAVRALVDGQGLLLVDKISHEWGTELTEDGKMVWGVVPTGFLPEQTTRVLDQTESGVGRRNTPVG